MSVIIIMIFLEAHHSINRVGGAAFFFNWTNYLFAVANRMNIYDLLVTYG